MDKAEAGTGWASVSNTNHYGIAGYYVIFKDFNWLVDANTTKLVAPLWEQKECSNKPYINAFPADKEPPIIIDLATCAAAYGKIEIKQNSQGDT